MACGCNCRQSTHTRTAPCTDCGPYGSTCCLKMTGLDETWYFRAKQEGELLSNAPPCRRDDEINSQNYLAWVDGDDCDLVSQDGRDIPYPGSGYQYNLCGQLSTGNPCRKLGDLTGVTPTSRRRPATITWQVADDCSAVAFTVYYYDADAVLTRYYGTAATDWLTTEAPVTVGPFTVTTCPPGEPARKIYNICCWQATIVAPMGTSTGQTLPDGDPLPAICETDPRYQCTDTEQCGSVGGSYNGSPTGIFVGDSAPRQGVVQIEYEVSQDYSTITLGVWGYLTDGPCRIHFSGDGSYLGGMLYQTFAFTPDWFLTPRVFDATGSAGTGTCEWEGATLTISVCGYEVVGPYAPCYDVDLYPLFVDIEDVAGLVDGGTYAMTWDGFEYTSGYTPATTDYQVQVRLRFNDAPDVPCDPELGGVAWDVFFDVWDVALDEFVETQLIQNLCLVCGGEPPGSGTVASGTGTVDATDVDFLIHD